MKRLILTATLAWLPAARAQPGTQTPAGKTIPPHEHHAGMDMQGMQCMADRTCGCCDHKEAT